MTILCNKRVATLEAFQAFLLQILSSNAFLMESLNRHENARCVFKTSRGVGFP